MSKITIELTEDQVREIIWAVNHFADKARWVNSDNPKTRKRGLEISKFRQRISNKLHAELVKL